MQTRQQLKNNLFHETQRIFVNTFCIWTPSGQVTNELSAEIFQSYLSILYIRIDVRHLCLASIAKFCKLRTWRTSRKTLKRWWGRLEKRRQWPAGTAGRRQPAAGGDETAGDETAATGGVMYTDEGELELDEDEMAALDGQRLVAELFPDSGSEPNFEGFHASELAGNQSGGDDSGSEAVTESDDNEGVTGRLSA